MVAPPTAHAPVADTALTADRPLPRAPPGLGLGTCDQRLPSQCTASVLNTLALVSWSPTAHASVADSALTARSCARGMPGGASGEAGMAAATRAKAATNPAPARQAHRTGQEAADRER